MYPGHHAQTAPERIAVVMARTGETMTYRQLEDRSVQLSRVMREAGLERGDHIAIMMENHLRFLEVYWGCIRSGLYVTPINRFLSAEEAAYIARDCEAKLIIASAALGDTAEQMIPLMPDCKRHLMIDGTRPGYESYEAATGAQPTKPLAEQPRGQLLLYSSGTTGHPKGIARPLRDKTIEDADPVSGMFAQLYSLGAGDVYLSPAPLYHAAAFGFAISTHEAGATLVIMEKFDALEALRSIEAYHVTHSQWVPTMFSRMLKLPKEDREGFDLSSHRTAIHGAAPCPPAVKREMIDWWGPIIHEYYGSSEGNGMTAIDSKGWLERPGSVGKSLLGTLHICDDDGNELPIGEDGIVYFERERVPFRYHKDESKSKSAQHPTHPTWTMLGDIGHLDEDGFLYLTDRKSFMIISGGVNIYPAESENVLVTHPKVMDVAVIGVPNTEFGEEVKAVVELVPSVEPSDALASELIDFCRDQLAHYKCPRTVDFDLELPRLPTGKLKKGDLRDRYWKGHASKLA